MITVALDAEHTRQTSAGTRRTLTSLVTALRERSDIRAIVVGGGPLLQRGTLAKRMATARQDFLWYPWLGRREAINAGAQVYHCPTPRAPLTRNKIPLVVTVHDLVPLLFPETMTPWSRIYGRLTLGRVLAAADIIAVPSKDTANDLITLTGIDPHRVRVVPNGVDPIFFMAPPEISSEDKKYVLFVGTPEPRKNLPRLVAAIESLAKRGYPYRLVIAGSGGWGRDRIDSSLVDFVGRVPDAQLRDLYSRSLCVAIPSLHEGFGLPAAEAMAAGSPVVAGNRGALPEIVGDAGVLVDPYNVTAIADGIISAIENRFELVKKGKVRAAQFSWNAAAASMAEIYRNLV
ncbi:MAG: glycosyltransferase family 1 protein [Gemmatimonadales bacterium]